MIIGVVLISCFSKNHIRKLDDKYRAEAGKTLDDALGDRK